MATLAPSGFFPTEVCGPLRAPAQIEQWIISRPDPDGLKHHESGSFKPSAKATEIGLPDGLRGGFTAQMESGVAIDFGQSIANTSGFLSETVALTFNLGEVNSHPNSFFNQNLAEIGTEFKAFNIRFWVNSFAAFESANPSGIPILYYLESEAWQRNFRLTPDTVGALPIPSSLPDTQNLRSNGTDPFVSGAFVEDEFTNFLYFVAEFPSGVQYVLGTYGGLGLGTFTFRFSYDWTGIDATVREGDLFDDCRYITEGNKNPGE